MENLNKYNFEEELKELAIQCTKLKPTTAKRKMAKLFNKYAEIIHYSKSWKESNEKESQRQSEIIKAYKNNSITYSTGDKIKGVIKIDNIEQVEINGDIVLVVTKNNREIRLGKSFEFLKDLF